MLLHNEPAGEVYFDVVTETGGCRGVGCLRHVSLGFTIGAHVLLVGVGNAVAGLGVLALLVAVCFNMLLAVGCA